MSKCKNCKFFKSNENNPLKGDCFGHEVDAEMDAKNCPTKSFQSKEEDNKKE